MTNPRDPYGVRPEDTSADPSVAPHDDSPPGPSTQPATEDSPNQWGAYRPQEPWARPSEPQPDYRQNPQQPYPSQGYPPPSGYYGPPQYQHPGYHSTPHAGQTPYDVISQDHSSGPGYSTGPAEHVAKTNSGTRARRRVIVVSAATAVVLVTVVVLAITAFYKPGFAVTDTLSRHSLESGVSDILRSDYQVGQVTNVTCPDGQKVKRNNTFQCSAKIGGEATTVPIRVLDDTGRYEVGRPINN